MSTENKMIWRERAEGQRTTLTFDFNGEAVVAAGLTTDELLEDMRSYAKECGIDEIEYGVFSKSGPDAMAMLIGYAVRKCKTDPDFMKYLNTWIADVDGNLEDCKVEIESIMQEQRRK